MHLNNKDKAIIQCFFLSVECHPSYVIKDCAILCLNAGGQISRCWCVFWYFINGSLAPTSVTKISLCLNTYPRSEKWILSLQMVNEGTINGKSEGNSLQLLMTALDYGLNDIILVSKEA